jgi:hypothetical protein
MLFKSMQKEVTNKRGVMLTSGLIINLILYFSLISGCDKTTIQTETDAGLDTENPGENEETDWGNEEAPKESEIETKSTVFKDEYKDIPTGLSPAAVVGSWYKIFNDDEDDLEIWTFNPDGSLLNEWTYFKEQYEGFWEVDGNIIAREDFLEEEYENDDGEIVWFKQKEKSISTAAVIDDMIYFDVMILVSDNASGPDGTWAYYLGIVEEEDDDGEVDNYDEYGAFIFEIEGDRFTFVYETEFYDYDIEGHREATIEGGGSIRVDGDRVYYKIEEESEGDFALYETNEGPAGIYDGSSIAYIDEGGDENKEELLGIIASDTVLVLGGNLDDTLEDIGHKKK